MPPPVLCIVKPPHGVAVGDTLGVGDGDGVGVVETVGETVGDGVGVIEPIEQSPPIGAKCAVMSSSML